MKRGTGQQTSDTYIPASNSYASGTYTYCEAAKLSAYYHIPFAEMDMLDVDRELFDKFSLDLMKKNKFIPVCISDGVLLIAAAKPLDCVAMSSFSSCFPGKTDILLVSASDIDRYIDSVSAALSTSAALNDLGDKKDVLPYDRSDGFADVSEEIKGTVNNPSVRLVDSIIKEAIPSRASDIHIEPFDKTVRVRYRIDGDLQNRAEFPIDSYPAICARIKILSGMNIAEKRVPQDGRINMNVGGKEYDLRVSTLPSVNGEKFVIRILDREEFKFTRDDLGFTDEENKIVDKMLSRPHGILLLTGPTGCGKSTTLYSFLEEINDPKVNIVTVEDPVEYTMEGITQTQVNVKANMTFATALRSILRQDPDIIMIGEIRDEETAEIAVRAAITGHLVFSTLHTNDAPGAITRLEDMGVPDYLVADALDGVIAQRLVKKLCPACKIQSLTDPRETELLGLDAPVMISRPQGCKFCNGTGYRGRTAVHEIMFMNEKMRNAVATEKNIEALREMAKENGMSPLWDSCKKMVLSGITGIDELMTFNLSGK